MTIPVEPHTQEQPGLRGHSHDPENDLLKQFVVYEKVSHGWLALKSFNRSESGVDWVFNQKDQESRNFKIVDQFDNDRLLWEENSKLDTIKKS